MPLSLRVAALAAVLALLPQAAFAAAYSDVLPQPGVVWMSDGVPLVPREPAVMRQTAKAFVPDVLIVGVGASVIFPNDDGYLHSVYSESAPNAFDLGLYDTGPGKIVTFAAPGISDVRCHIHGSMHATIIVVDGPYARTTQPAERYRFVNVRPGRHALHVWTAEHGETVRTVTVR